jgi:hypothetical protein
MFRVDFENPSTGYRCNPEVACAVTGYQEQTTCGAGYSGFACGNCDLGYYKQNANCKKCPSEFVQGLVIFLFAAFLVVVVFRFTTASSEIPSDVRIILQAVQMIAIFPNVSVKWPSFLYTILQILSISVSLSSLFLFMLIGDL